MKPLFKDPSLQEEIDRQGYLVIRLLKDSQIDGLIGLYQESIDQGAVSDLYESSRHNSPTTNEKINQAIEAELTISGKDIFQNGKLYGGTFMVKSFKDSTILPAHQDWSVVEENEHRTFFIWCPLQDVTPLNGGLFVVPGSHKYFDILRSGTYPSNRYVLPHALQHCIKDIFLKAGEAVFYYDRLFHGSYANSSNEDRIVVTGRIAEEHSELLYFHKQSEEEVDVYAADAEFYLTHIDLLAKGELPAGLSKLCSRPYRHEPVTDESLRQKITENFPVSEDSGNCRLFMDEGLQQLFDRDGYVVIDLLEQKQVDDLTDFYRGLEHAPMPEYGFQVSLDNNQSDVVKTISQTLKETVNPFLDQKFERHQIFTASFVVKEQNPLGVVPPHQDWTFVDERKYWSATVWCPLIDVNMHNGGLGVIQGSHRFYDHVRPSPSPQYEPPFKDQMFSIFPYIRVIELKAGQALVFDNRTFHASLPNTTDQTRIAFGLGITHQDAQIQHFYMLPNQEKVLVERYDVNPDFFYSYNNARLSAMFAQGQKPVDLCSTGLFEYSHKEFSSPKLIEMLEGAGNVPNVPLMEKMAGLFGYELDGTKKQSSPEPAENLHPEPKRSFWKVYTPTNIYREIQFRIDRRRAHESLWQVYVPRQLLDEIKHRFARN